MSSKVLMAVIAFLLSILVAIACWWTLKVSTTLDTLVVAVTKLEDRWEYSNGNWTPPPKATPHR